MLTAIIFTYNHEKSIAKCIESILAQTYTNLEILINNDGSTDDSYKIIGKDEYGNGMCLGVYPSYESVQLVLDNIIKTLSYYKDPLFKMP